MEQMLGTLAFRKPINHTVKAFRSPFVTFALRHSEHANAVPFHCHDYDEFIYSPNGLSQLKWSNRESTVIRRLHPTTILWTPAGVPHSAEWDSAWYSVGILIGKEFLDSCLDQLKIARSEKTIFLHARQELTTLLKLALSPDWLDKTSSNQPFARSLAVMLSYEFAGSYQASTRLLDDSNEKLPLKRIFDYIDSNLNRELCLQDLAELTNLSPHHFARLFKDSTGYSPYQYVVSRRLNYGLHLLSSKSLSIDEIAASTGFASASSFAKAFKRVYRVSPAKYLKNLVSE